VTSGTWLVGVRCRSPRFLGRWANLSVGRLVGRLRLFACVLFGRLVALLVDWLTLFVCLFACLVGWLFTERRWMVGWFAALIGGWLVGRTVDWFIVGLWVFWLVSHSWFGWLAWFC